MDLYGAQAPFEATGLPTPDGSDVYIEGQAHLSHFALTDGECQTIAFAVDGNLYDKDGYLMADAKGEDCNQCLEPGVMEMLAIPVPGQCGLYYIVTSAPGNNVGPANAGLSVAVLDLALPSAYHAGRHGRLVNLDGELGALYPNISFGNNAIVDGFVVNVAPDDDNKSNSPMLRAIKVGEAYWLYAVYATRVVQFKLDALGVVDVPTVAGDHIPVYLNQDPFQPKAFHRDASVALATNGEVRLALTDQVLYPWPIQQGTPPSYPVLVMRFDPSNNGALLGVQGLSPNQNGYPDFQNANMVTTTDPGLLQDGPSGCAWVQNASKLVVSGRVVEGTDWVPAIAEYDMVTASWTDLLPTLAIQGSALEYVRTRMYRNVAPDGVGVAIYLPYPGGVAAITGADQGTYAFLQSVGFGGGVPDVFDPEYGIVLFAPRFLNAQVAGDATVAAYNDVACCEVRSNYEGYHGYTFPVIPGNYDWTATSNPFGNCPEVLFLDDLIIPAGVHLTIDGMHLKFAPTAHMILRAGAFVDADHSAFTPEDCLGVRWQGIRVEGVPTEPTQNSTVQGQLWLDDCLVEEAHVGIWCGREGDADHGGGFFKCYDSRIRDCIVGARVMQYHRIVGNTPLPNKCSFQNTRFEVTLGWPDLNDNLPKAQVHLYDVDGVGITRCAFTNGFSVLLMPPHSRGVGILSFQASYRCRGFGDFANNHFRQLYAGIVNVANDPLFANSVDGMHFDRNLVGVYDMYCFFSKVKNNKFTAMTSAQQVDDYLSMGMYIDQSAGYVVERNYFEDIDGDQEQEVGSVGIWFHGEQVADNRIYDNEFHDLTIGNVAEGKHHGLNDQGPQPINTGLQWLCGLYEGEVYDQFLLSPDGTIKIEQGFADPDLTAGNVFAGPTDCSTTFEPVVYDSHYQPYHVTYHFYENAQSPDCRPECVEDENGTDLYSTGHYYDLIPAYGALPFDAAQHCNGGVLDAQTHVVAVHMAAYQAKYAELRSTAAAVAGQLDDGDKTEVLEAIKADPAWPSHQLRSFLLARSPLSEEAIITAILREVPMDPWHLTQVLIANSRLSGQIWAELLHADLLSPFFINMIREHEDDPSYREALMQELRLRADEKELEQRLLVNALEDDSTYTGKLDTLLTVLSADTLGTGRAVAYQLALSHGLVPEAAQLAGLLVGEPRYAMVLDLGSMLGALGYDWSQAGPSELAALASKAGNGTALGRAAAWGIRYALGATDSLPNGVLPFAYRSAVQAGGDTAAMSVPVVGAYPNPAKDRMMITYPADLEGATLEVLDATGRSVYTERVGSGTAFTELDVRGWNEGLYLARVLQLGAVIGETKCAIVR